MATCVTCGDELHPERAERYDYCTKRECRQQNAKALPIVAVGVNKAADQFVVLDERTEKEMASGRYKKVPETPALTYRAMGLKPDEIAKKLGVSPYLVTQILLAAASHGKR